MAAILRDQPEPLTSVTPMPALAARVVDRCLEKRPEDRPESILDTAFALEAASASASPLADDVQVAPLEIARRALAATVGVVVVLTLLMWAYVGLGVRRAIAAAVAENLSDADAVVLRVQQDRLERLHVHARLVASIPQLHALSETDAPTIGDFLQNHLQRNPGPALLIALRPGGDALGWSDTTLAIGPGTGGEWLEALVTAGGLGTISINGRPYHAAIANAEAGGTIFASIVAATPMDDRFARAIRETAESEAVLLDANAMVGTSLRAGLVPWRSLTEWHAAGGGAARTQDVQVGGLRYTAREIPIAREPMVSAVVLASGGDLTGRYGSLQRGVLAIGLVTALLVLAGGLLALRRLDAR